MTRLIQIKRANEHRVALVDEPRLRLLGGDSTIYSLANSAVRTGMKLSEVIRQQSTQEFLEYDSIYAGNSEWRILPAIAHPEEPSRLLISGTGLTHLGSARERQNMHASTLEPETDSMKMFRWGVEGGRPKPGSIGTAPEWFYKGTGTILRAHDEALDVPPYAEDGGEEAEIAGVYLIAPDGQPLRIGMAAGNEFSDHRFEKHNYLNLASSKLRTCALGPELVIDADFQSVPGEVTITRREATVWSKKIRTGEAEMCHSLGNIEHHHFKYDAHRRPGDLHVHFVGADCLSFGEGVELANGDVMQVKFEGFGRALRNSVRVDQAGPRSIRTIPL